MNEQDQSNDMVMVPCEECLKEIPKADAQYSETPDYVMYFCGLECYEKWKQDNPG